MKNGETLKCEVITDEELSRLSKRSCAYLSRGFKRVIKRTCKTILLRSQSRSPSPFSEDAPRFGHLERPVFHHALFTIETIRQLHRVAVSVLRGEFGPNEPRTIAVAGHVAVDRDLVTDRLKVLVLWLNEEGPQFSASKFAAMAFYFFVKLHGFSDGNGRTGRLLLSLILRRAGLLPWQVPESAGQELNARLKGSEKDFVRYLETLIQHDLM
uniref:Fido domain-containing protein n=1 Tax=Globodera pallida TaxID=36090 RepID=A0A183BKN3_GLOPA